MNALLLALLLTIPGGEFKVGVRDVVFENGDRQLSTSIFYPTSEIRGKTAKMYLSDPRLAQAMKEDKYLNYVGDTIDSWTQLATHSYPDAAPAKGKFPLVFIMHGRGSSRVNYTFLAEEIASHGYVVAIADYPGSGLTITKDGTKIGLAAPPDLDKEIKQITKDIAFLETEIPKDNFFASIVDKNNVGMIGHSLGSLAMFNILLENHSFNAAVNLDGYPFGEAETRGVNIPHLTIWGEIPKGLSAPPDTLTNRRYRDWKKFIAASNKDHLVIKMRGMYHADFNDSMFFRSEADRSRNTGGTIDPATGFRITSKLVTTYLDHRLKKKKRKAVLDVISKNPELSIVFSGTE